MDYGIALISEPDSWKTAKRAEELGFSHCWFADSPILVPDVFVAMGAAAVKTTKIKLGTGVLVPSNRIAPVAANALASLNVLAPGRIVFGVGTGFTARNTMALKPYPLSALKEYVRVVRALLRRETIEATIEDAPRKIRFLNPDGLLNLDDPIPLHFATWAPKAQKLTAEIGDGWIDFVPSVDQGVAEIERIVAACRAVGRDPKTLHKQAQIGGCVLGAGEAADSPRARAQAGPVATVIIHAGVEADHEGIVAAELRELVREYRKMYETFEPADARYLTLHSGHLIFVRPEEQRFLSADLLRAMTFTATEPELVEKVRRLRDAGYDQVTVWLMHGQEASAIEDWARVFDKV
jgi:5,10-methylenetetrahydromethanopterin reductase